MSQQNLPIVSDDNINGQLADLTQQIIDEEDPNKAKGLVEQFNWSIARKNALRILKLYGLFDSISEEMIKRFEKNPGNFANNELIDYLTTVQAAIEKSSKVMKSTEEPQLIQIKQDNNINVNILDNFDRDSKERIADAIKSILSQAGSGAPIYETDYEQIDNSNDE